ncbi:MAG: monovalent cation/H(+) antiporter subunit G [Chloroflexota bacterium]|nr:monovalent cation/H(+) antiporter subunit G [Chloroflexota bacterium]
MMINDILGAAALIFGLFFSVVGIIGLIRFPDVYCRIHASGKVATLGLVGLLVASAIAIPETALKALALALFVVITSPVASHAIASAAYRTGVPMHKKGDAPQEPRWSTDQS